MTQAPTISVVVPVYNGGEPLRLCLQSLRAQTHSPLEVIVVDDGSTDGSAEVAEALADRVVRLAGKGGPGRARNAGAAVARGAILAFTDADCVLPPSWLARIDDALTDPALGAVAGGYSFAAVQTFVARFNLHELAFRRRGYGDRVDTAPGANLAVRRALFESVGGFPTDLAYASTEDMVLTLRLSRREPLGWLADNGVGHHFRETVGSYVRQQFNFARPTPGVYLGHRSLLTARSHHPRSGFVTIPGTALLLAGLSLTPLAPLLGAPVVLAGLGLSLLPEGAFLAWLAAEESPAFAARAIPLLILRNGAWLAGVVTGLFEVPAVAAGGEVVA